MCLTTKFPSSFPLTFMSRLEFTWNYSYSGIGEAGYPLWSYLDLFLSPLVEVHWFYPGYMYPEIPVDPSTPNADKHANVPGGPSRPCEDRQDNQVQIMIMLQPSAI